MTIGSLYIAAGLGIGTVMLTLPQAFFQRRQPEGKHDIVHQLQRDRKTMWDKLDLRLQQSGSGIGIHRYVGLAFLCGLVSFAVSQQILKSWILALPAFFAGVLFVERLVSVLGARKKDRFEADNVKAIRLMASSLRTSPSYLHAFEQVAASPYLDKSVTAEYSRVVELLRAQVPLERIMESFYQRTGSTDIRYLATIVSIQREMGGDMAKTLDLAASTILRKKQSLRRQRAAMAQITAQVNLLSIMPFIFIIALYANNPLHFEPLTATLSGRLTVLAALGSILIGGEVIRHLARKGIHKGG
ncbi:type II secretion system F family protein [Brevibacillus ruminantium]|uniref:Type II secretion system F family protein n=1 Tax=Brevibacillus ruminantium TaxID=2950604 RepID=A0ABY4WG12_9BACL|nr:type II secretion system F family protein [Brevibacillus ruminantium]USG65973.1 type II secretion system F family protein [Brevibacillus ruminantium]